jgi:hypothetical protein
MSNRQEVLDNTTVRDTHGNPLAKMYLVTFTDDESVPCVLIVPFAGSGDRALYRYDGGNWRTLGAYRDGLDCGDLADALAEIGETMVAEIEELELDIREVATAEELAAYYRQPARYEAMVEQSDGYHHDDLGNRDGCQVRTITIITEGQDYTDDWNVLSEADRDAHDKWVEELHDALVAIAWEEPAVRDRVDELMREHDQEYQPEALRACLDDAKTEMARAS